MRVGIIASPFIPVPPENYGGTELFVANLAEGLLRRGVEVVVYANGESQTRAELRCRYPQSEWPLPSESAGMLKEVDHTAWALNDAVKDCDILQINQAVAVACGQFISTPTVYTIHHPLDDSLTRLYAQHSELYYVAISHHQASCYSSMELRVIPHGIDLVQYHSTLQRQPYLVFLGRICPQKGTHIAIEIARKADIPLRIAGEVQPIFREYFERQVKPYMDGHLVEYLGPVDLSAKNELLGHSMGMLFPIQWDEPFGLVLIEAMACGAPVFALPGGSVGEVVREGVSGVIRRNSGDLATAVRTLTFHPAGVRKWVEQRFSMQLMTDRYLQYYRQILNLPVNDDEVEEVMEDAA